MVAQWSPNGRPTVAQWATHGRPTVAKWSPMVVHWSPNGRPMVAQCSSNGRPMFAQRVPQCFPKTVVRMLTPRVKSPQYAHSVTRGDAWPVQATEVFSPARPSRVNGKPDPRRIGAVL